MFPSWRISSSCWTLAAALLDRLGVIGWEDFEAWVVTLHPGGGCVDVRQMHPTVKQVIWMT